MRFNTYKQNIVGNVLFISCLVFFVLSFATILYLEFEGVVVITPFLFLLFAFLGINLSSKAEKSFFYINDNYRRIKRFRNIVNPEYSADDNSVNTLDRKDVLEVAQRNTKVKYHLADLEYIIIDYVKFSGRAYRSGRIEELDTEVRDLYKDVAQLILSDGVKSALSGRADAFKKDIVELVVSLIIQQTREVKKITNTALAVIDSDGEIAEKDAISVLKDPKYKHLIK